MSIPVSAFDLTSGAVILRLICGAFFIPHIYFKIVGDPPPALGFFKTAGFKPAAFYMRVAMVVETIGAIGLLLGIYTQWAALLAAASLFIAGIAVCFANRSVKWLWNLGGMEFPIFWSIACLAVALLYWK
ncbi:MAG TPA: DoxX family protein [Noviherbaspirillum sp.]|uniref:DoxX family protein n=1 Tax=Noviherbaspirillum sp. TaxID=1926288 RepID=UPI002B4642AD|nr:DoxX family protein [Noviherbaspirillum sp.]HJV85397.1 DoxX family protein [Noviherbaspirillum sp.]